MMMFEVGGKKLVAGLSWHPLSSEKFKVEVATIAEDEDAKIGLVRSFVDGDQIHRQLATSKNSKCKNVVSAAAILAEVADSILLVEEINKKEGLFWLCVVSGHQVVVGHDIIIRKDNLINRLPHVLTDLGLDSVQIRICLPASLADLASEIGLNAETLSLEDLVTESHKNITKDFESLKLKTLKNPFTLLLALLVAIS